MNNYEEILKLLLFKDNPANQLTIAFKENETTVSLTGSIIQPLVVSILLIYLVIEKTKSTKKNVKKSFSNINNAVNCE